MYQINKERKNVVKTKHNKNNISYSFYLNANVDKKKNI